MSVPRKRTYTISEAAELTGLSRKAISRRVERGSLRSVVRRGRRLIPRSELVRAELIPSDGEAPDRSAPGAGFPSPLNAPFADQGVPLGDPALTALLRELLERLERQASEIAHFRAITAHAESLRREDEVSELRARLLALENERLPPELEATAPSIPGRGVSGRRDARTRVSQERIWLPPSARRGEATAARVATQPPPVPPARATPRFATGRRVAAFAAEAIFIVAVAAGAWLLDLAPIAIVGVVGIAWILVALLEWLRYRRA